MVILRNQVEIDRLRQAGHVTARALTAATAAARAGVRLRDLDAAAEAVIRDAGAVPSFLGYHPSWAPRPFPGTLCLSINDVIVHGPPTDRVLRDGDVLSLDCGAVVDGYHGDSARTIVIGAEDQQADRLLDTTRRALEAGIKAAVPGGRMGDISHAIESVSRGEGYGLPAGFGGHGVGTSLHEDPSVPNTGLRGRGLPLRAGMVLAIEPMLIEGGHDQTRMLPDGWSVGTADGSRSAHFEHTIAITPDGPEILTVAE